MPTCKSCLHVELCKEDLLNSMKGLGLSNEQEIIEIGLNNQNNGCKFFKDSSKFIEIPFIPSQNVYFYSEVENKIVEAKVRKVVLSEAFPCRPAIKIESESKTSYGFFPEHYSELYLSRKEAEQALKERNDNE